MKRTSFIAALAVAALSLGLVACGGSSSSTTTSASAARGGFAGRFANNPKLAACLKAHGATLPSFSGRGRFRGSGNGRPPFQRTNGTTPTRPPGQRRFPGANSPQFQKLRAQFQKLRTAMQACGVNIPGPGSGGPGAGPPPTGSTTGSS